MLFDITKIKLLKEKNISKQEPKVLLQKLSLFFSRTPVSPPCSAVRRRKAQR